MQQNKIGFFGEGWGAIVAIKSLQEYFDVECFSSDKDVIKELVGDSKLINSFNDFTCKILLCAGYKSIISTKLLKKHQIINIHYSLLPSYRGLHSTAWAIMNGEKSIGLTIHLMNKNIDDGPILHQKIFINDQISSATHYMEKMNNYIFENLGEIISKYVKGSIIPAEQEKEKASWVGKRGIEHNIINFHKDFEYTRRLFRVLQFPYPQPYIKYKGILYNVEKISFHKSNINTDICRILNNDEDGIWIKSKEGYIILKEISTLDGRTVDKKIFKIGDYLND